MRAIRLGTSTAAVTPLCIGTMWFGTLVSEEVSHRLLDVYHERGGRFIDTANVYSTWLDGFPEPVSEALIGRWLEYRNVREDYFVATKMGVSYKDVPAGLTSKLIHDEVEKSLNRLRTDTIDLLYAHIDDFNTPQEETMQALHEVIQKKKVRYIGASNFFAWRVARANQIAENNRFTPFCCVQNNFSYLWPKRGAKFGSHPATEELLHLCSHSKLTLVAYWALLKGCYGRDDREIPEQYQNEVNRGRLELVRSISAKRNINGNQTVLAWMIQSEPPVIPLITGSEEKQINQNMDSMNIQLSPKEMESLNNAFGID
jgi:aryl-alcohol dehydrogenase-like predicted oxidoreductase